MELQFNCHHPEALDINVILRSNLAFQSSQSHLMSIDLIELTHAPMAIPGVVGLPTKANDPVERVQEYHIYIRCRWHDGT